MLRLVALCSSLGMSFLSSVSGAEVILKSFHWRASGTVDIHLEDDRKAFVIHGDLRDDEFKTAGDAHYTAQLHSYAKDGFVTIVLTSDTRDIGNIFILERYNGEMVLVNETPIHGRKAFLVESLENIVKRLEEGRNQWPPRYSLRKIKEYFAQNPTKMINDFYDEVELGEVVQTAAAPKPMYGVGQGPSIRTPAVPIGAKPVALTPGGGSPAPASPAVVAPGAPLNINPQLQAPAPTQAAQEPAAAAPPPGPTAAEIAAKKKKEAAAKKLREKKQADRLAKKQQQRLERELQRLQEQSQQVPPPPDPTYDSVPVEPNFMLRNNER